MSVTSEIKNPSSPLRQFIDRIANPDAVNQWVAAHNLQIIDSAPLTTPGADPLLVGMAMIYRFRLEMGTFTNTAAHMTNQDWVASLTDGSVRPEDRATVAVMLALLDQLGRSGKAQPALLTLSTAKDKIKAARNIDDLKSSIEDVRLLSATMREQFNWEDRAQVPDGLLYHPNPTFAGSKHVGGGDAPFILDRTLWSIRSTRKTSPMTPDHLRQMVAYLLLDYENEYDIKQVAWWWTRQRKFISVAVDTLITDLPAKRAKCRDALSKAHRRQGIFKASEGSALLRSLDDVYEKHHGDFIPDEFAGDLWQPPDAPNLLDKNDED